MNVGFPYQARALKMGNGTVLARIEQDLQDAQAEIETAKTVEGSFGDSLKFGFAALYAAVHNLIAGFSDHARKIDDLDNRLKATMWAFGELKKEVHGLKVAKGKAVAAKKRTLVALAKAEGAIDTISLH